ncbi:twin-arginine translocation signal domain-containing protein, partial [Staphylococcus aureus]
MTELLTQFKPLDLAAGGFGQFGLYGSHSIHPRGSRVKSRDDILGMGRNISRRDFINGVAVAAGTLGIPSLSDARI